MSADDHLNPDQFYHGSLSKFRAGQVLTPEGRDPDGSIHSGDYVYAASSVKTARYFASQHDTSPQTDASVYVHQVTPVGTHEAHSFGGERPEFASGNIRAKALRVVGDGVQHPGHYAPKN
jgi:hypothetical protein